MSETRKTFQTGAERAWRLYELGRNYNSSLTPSQYNLVETNWNFFIGNQWPNLPQTPAMQNIPRPTFNILKRVASLFIASLTSSAVSIHVEPLPANAPSPLSQDTGGMGGMGYGGMENPDMGARGGQGQSLYGNWSAEDRENIAKFANSEIENLLEKFKFEYRLREALFDGAVTGDYCAHFWFDPEAHAYNNNLPGSPAGQGEIRMELVDGIDVMFGNPNDPCVENQPYILIVGRDTVENLREEAKRVRQNQRLYRAAMSGGTDERDGIQADNDTADFPGAGGYTELESGDDETGKARYVLLYTKRETESEVQGPYGPEKRKTVTVHVTKATQSAVIYEDVDTGLDLYPIAWGCWERQKNQYHGRSLITGMIPNQVFINKMFAIAMRNMQVTAFPKTVYNADLISCWDNDPAQAIGIHGLTQMDGQVLPIPQVAATLPATAMSGQIFDLIDKAVSYTKDCLGATDAQLGSVKPENTSALMVLQTNAEVPLENIRAGLHEWTEDIGRILLDMMGTYYGLRDVVVERTCMDVSTNALGGILFGPDGGLMTQPVTKKMVEPFDFDVFKNLWLNLRVDVGADTYFSKIAMVQTLDNLRRDGVLDIAQYLERLPDNLIPKKDELIREFRERGGAAGMPGQGQASGNYAQGGPMDEAAAVMGLPGSMQANYGQMNHIQKRTALQMGARKLR